MLKDGGRSYWELEPADTYTREMTIPGQVHSVPTPVVTNNPDSLPKARTWAVRKLDEAPLLLDQKRLRLQMFALVYSTEPLRVYLHHDAVVWRAGRKHDMNQPHLDALLPRGP